MRRAATILLSLLLAGGCSSSPASAPPWDDSTSPPAGSIQPAADPVRVEIPSIRASSTLAPLVLDAKGALEVPKTAEQAGWYADGVTPGDPGPGIIVGHIDYAGDPGVFQRLDELEVGDEVYVATADATVLRFVVYRTQQVSKAAFPWREVAADTEGPELRIISCTGKYRPEVRSYSDNLIVFARIAT